jgi:hypothetical protein
MSEERFTYYLNIAERNVKISEPFIECKWQSCRGWIAPVAGGIVEHFAECHPSELNQIPDLGQCRWDREGCDWYGFKVLEHLIYCYGLERAQ